MKRLSAFLAALLLSGVASAQYTVDSVGFLVDSTGRRVGFKKTNGGEVFFPTFNSALTALVLPDGTTLTTGLGDVTLTGSQTLTNKTLTAPTINGGTATALTGLAVRNAGTGAFDATIRHNGTLTAGRTLSLDLLDGSRTLVLSGDVTFSGAFAATFTLTGATGVTFPTSGTLATTSQALAETFCVAASDETTALTTGTGKVTFRMPFAMTLTSVRGSLATAQTSGSIVTFNVKESGTTVFSTKPTFDNAEKTTTTAATASVLSDTTLADDAEMTVDIDQIGDSTAKGLKVCLIGSR